MAKARLTEASNELGRSPSPRHFPILTQLSPSLSTAMKHTPQVTERGALAPAGDAPPARGGSRQSHPKEGRHARLAHAPGGARPGGLGQEGKRGGLGSGGKGGDGCGIPACVPLSPVVVQAMHRSGYDPILRQVGQRTGELGIRVWVLLRNA